MKNILIVRVSAIGDVIHTFPATILLKQTHPQATIHWVVQHKAAALLFNQSFVDHVWVLPNHYLSVKHWNSTRKIIQKLKVITWDAIIDFQGLLKTLMLYTSLRGTKYGFDKHSARSRWTSWFTHKTVTPEWNNIVQKNLALASYVAHNRYGQHIQPTLTTLAKQFTLYVPKQQQRVVDRCLSEHNIKKFIMFASNTTWLSKHWPTPHWQSTIIRLLQQTEYDLVFVGASFGKQAATLTQWIKQNKLPIHFVPAWDLLTLSYAIKKAELMVAPDTGLLHLADFVGTRSIALFGPTFAYRHGPFITVSNQRYAQQAICPHAYQKQHGTQKSIDEKNNCMYTLRPDHVYDAIVTYLAASSRIPL